MDIRVVFFFHKMYLEEIPDYLAMGLSAEYHKLKLEFSARGGFVVEKVNRNFPAPELKG